MELLHNTALDPHLVQKHSGLGHNHTQKSRKLKRTVSVSEGGEKRKWEFIHLCILLPKITELCHSRSVMHSCDASVPSGRNKGCYNCTKNT